MPRYVSSAEFLGIWGSLVHCRWPTWVHRQFLRSLQMGVGNRVDGSLGKTDEKGDGQTFVRYSTHHHKWIAGYKVGSTWVRTV